MCTSFFMAAIYDRFMRVGEEACVREWRRELLSSAAGRVLEIGAGTGLNLDHYGTETHEVVLCEPDPHMRRKLVAKVRMRHDLARTVIRVVDASAESLPFDDGEFDCVVSTLVLCSVQDPFRSLSEVRRVLRPGGALLFLEHVADADPEKLAWQRRIEPMWRRVAGNCHLQRKTCRTIEAAGFTFRDLERERMTRGLPFVRETVRGVALRAG